MDILKKIAYVFTKRQKAGIAVLFVVIVIGAFLELAGVTIIMPFVNAIMNPNYIMDNEAAAYIYKVLGMSSVTQFIILITLVLIAVYILKNLFVIFMTNMQYRYMYNYQRKLAEKMLSCYIRQPYLYHLKHGGMEMIRNVNDDVRSFFAVVISALQVLTEVCVCFVLVCYLLYMDKSITIGVCLVLIVFMASYMLFIRKKVTHMGEETREYLKNINQGIVQSFSGIKEVKILNREKYFIDTFKKNYKGYAEYQTLYFIYGLLPRPLMEAVCITGMLIVIVLKLLNGTGAAYFVPTVSVFAIAAFRMMPSFSRITNNINNIMFNMPSVNVIYRELKNIEELEGYNVQAEEDRKAITFEDSICVQDVDFRYPEVEKYVLKDVSITIPKNKSVAFVGPSGEGKTTLADIVLGLLNPEKGIVAVDGSDIKENIGAWHKKLGYIPQAIYLMDDTIKNNIVFGLPEEDIDEERLWKALEDSQIKEFVETLEMGVETQVGERGVRLSGGQRQRIGIARALYNNPEILILDEATSALDNDTEKAVMEAVEHLAGQKTLIIIAHRLSTIENCDIVYEVSGGTVNCVRKERK